MYKALITDLDGTAIPLSSTGADIPESTKSAIQVALQSGMKITCATGRQWKLAKPVISSLGLISPCIIEGGTRIIDPITEQTIWEKSFETGESFKLLKIIKAESKAGLLMDSFDTSYRDINAVQSVPDVLRFLFLLNVEQHIADTISHRVASETNAIAHSTLSWFGNGLVDIHITHPEATKQHAIEVWQDMEGISKDQTIGMGDSGNDVPIFLASGYRVAVGNATLDLKSKADLVTKPITEDPLEYVINTILMKQS